TSHRAEELLNAGQPAALLDVKLPLPFVITAAGYVEKYGPDERYNFLRFVAGVPCPTLLTFGGLEVETNMAFRGLPEALAEMRARAPRLPTRTFAGADPFSPGAREPLLDAVEAWLRGS